MSNERACLSLLSKHIQLSVPSVIHDLHLFCVLQNAVGKMRSLALVLTSFNLLQVVVRCQELSVIRHSDGDIFTIEGKYSVNSDCYISIYFIEIRICEERQFGTTVKNIAFKML